MERCCGTCKWHLYENVDEGFVCPNCGAVMDLED